MTKLIRFPVDIGRLIAETAARDDRTFTGQMLYWLKKGMEADGVPVDRDGPDDRRA